jgi:type II pantothenate kinase
MLAAIDLGGTNTDLLLAEPDGTVIKPMMLPSPAIDSAERLEAALAEIGVSVSALTAIGLTGGRHRVFPGVIGAIPLRHVDELRAIGRGGLVAAGVDRALVMSMGTGTALVAAGPEGLRHLGGTAIGGGTIVGLARLLLGTSDPYRIGDLASRGDPRTVDLSVGDIVGGPVGVVPAEMTASHFGRVAQSSHSGVVSPENIAAGLMELVGQALGRIGLMAARAQGLETVVLTGHVADWPGIHAAIERVAYTFGGSIIVPINPGFATARGVLSALIDGQRG